MTQNWELIVGQVLQKIVPSADSGLYLDSLSTSSAQSGGSRSITDRLGPAGNGLKTLKLLI